LFRHQVIDHETRSSSEAFMIAEHERECFRASFQSRKPHIPIQAKIARWPNRLFYYFIEPVSRWRNLTHPVARRFYVLKPEFASHLRA